MVEIVCCGVVLLLLLEDVAEAPPGSVVPLLRLQRFSIAFLCLLKVLDLHVFVPAQRMSVGEEGIELNSSTEELERSLMLFLERVAVAENAPGLWSLQTPLQGIVGDVAEIHLLPQVPEAGRVVLEALESVSLLLHHCLVHLCRLCVLRQLEMAASNLSTDPGCLKMCLWQFLVHLDGFGAPVVSLQLIGLA